MSLSVCLSLSSCLFEYKISYDMPYHNPFLLSCVFFVPLGKTVPKLDLVRKHLMIEGQIEKDCLVRILNEVTDIYRKSSLLLFPNLKLKASFTHFLYANLSPTINIYARHPPPWPIFLNHFGWAKSET